MPEMPSEEMRYNFKLQIHLFTFFCATVLSFDRVISMPQKPYEML